MERQEYKPQFNRTSRELLRRFSGFELRQINTRKQDLWEGMKGLEPALESDTVDQGALQEMLIRARRRIIELNALTQFVLKISEAAHEVLQTGDPLQFPDEVGRSFLQLAANGSIVSSTINVVDQESQTLEDPTVPIPKYGTIKFILAGEQLALELQFGRENEELGTIEPTIEPSSYQLVRA